MQEPMIKLKEILWEITGECHNGCAYCGSSSVWKEKTDENKIKCIVDEIAKFPPEQIDISGGDPSLVSLGTHKYIKEVLSNVGVKVKVLLNPKSILNAGKRKFLTICDLYDWVGISINTKEELELAKELMIPNMTIITNFNLSNIFLFDKIFEFVKNWNVIWQIQYTVYKSKVFEEENPLALYENEETSNYLFDKINNAMDVYDKIVIADNMNNGRCSAGIYSIGILSNGDVIPCLSMRSWTSNCDKDCPNMLNKPLETIWENEFKRQRFGSFFCCKDTCKNRCFERKPNKDIKLDPYVQPCQPPIATLYGVSPGTGTYAYAVYTPVYGVTYPQPPITPYVIMYGVSSPPVTCYYAVFSESSSSVAKYISTDENSNDYLEYALSNKTKTEEEKNDNGTKI